jgi:endonuclease/exonuclease/phosphatase family metal-dependent hydrolase
MAEKSKRGTRFLSVITLLVVVFYVLSLAGWYFDASQFWIGAVFSISFAYLWPALILVTCCWFIFKKSIGVLLLGFLLAGIPPAKATFSIGPEKKFSVQKTPPALRVMQWNAMDMPISGLWSSKIKEDRKMVKSFLETYKPDVICIQDFNEIEGLQFLSNIGFLRDSMGLSYIYPFYRAYSIYPYGKVKMGMVIASRYPFIQTGFVGYDAPEYANPILWADIWWQGKPLRIVTTHFQSMNLFSHRHFNPHTLPYYFRPDSAIIMSPNVLMKLRHYQRIHVQQAKRLAAFIDTASLPIILSADLNTVPANHVVRMVKRHRLSDGFLGSKTGLGNTFNYLLPNLRVDYLLHDKPLKAIQWKHFQEGFFDHDHLIGDFSWR